MHHPDGPRPTVPTRRRLPEAPTPRASRRSFACLNSTAGLTSRLQLRTSSTAIFHLPDRVAWTNKGRKSSLSAVTLMPRAAYRPSFRGSPSSHCTFDPIRSPDNGLHGHKCETIGQQESEFQL